MRRLATLAMLGLMLAVASGCETYALRGKVVPGTAPSVEVVKADDPRLEQRGLGDAAVLAMLEPTRVTRELIGETRTGPDGTFAIPVDKFGAGLLEYDVLIAARAAGHAPSERVLRMPGGGKRFLITIAPGRERGLQYGDPLQDTLREAEPYLLER